MKVEGKRLKRSRLFKRGRYVVEVDAEMVVPPDDPSEPCYESETVEFLRQVAERAEQGDTAWLHQHGRVYELVEPAGEQVS